MQRETRISVGNSSNPDLCQTLQYHMRLRKKILLRDTGSFLRMRMTELS